MFMNNYKRRQFACPSTVQWKSAAWRWRYVTEMFVQTADRKFSSDVIWDEFLSSFRPSTEHFKNAQKLFWISSRFFCPTIFETSHDDIRHWFTQSLCRLFPVMWPSNEVKDQKWISYNVIYKCVIHMNMTKRWPSGPFGAIFYFPDVFVLPVQYLPAKNRV